MLTVFKSRDAGGSFMTKISEKELLGGRLFWSQRYFRNGEIARDIRKHKI
jgi:hypothetical protein